MGYASSPPTPGTWPGRCMPAARRPSWRVPAWCSTRSWSVLTWSAPTCGRSPTGSSRSKRGSRDRRGMVETDPLLTVFFYGTLKRGHANHDRFCRGYLTVEEARTRGRLYSLPFGHPALVIDEEDIRAVGTTDRSEEHTSELQSRQYLVCRLLLEKK